MNGKYLLDTNVIIDLINNNRNIKLSFDNNKEIIIPSIVIGELYFGAYNSKDISKNINTIINLIIDNNIINCSVETAEIYGKVKSELRLKGRPIPENDIWIASIAIQNNLILVSKDKHFNEIDDLKLEVW